MSWAKHNYLIYFNNIGSFRKNINGNQIIKVVIVFRLHIHRQAFNRTCSLLFEIRTTQRHHSPAMFIKFAGQFPCLFNTAAKDQAFHTFSGISKIFCLIHNILNTLIACKISEVFQLFFLGFPLIRNHMKIGNSKIMKRTKQILLHRLLQTNFVSYVMIKYLINISSFYIVIPLIRRRSHSQCKFRGKIVHHPLKTLRTCMMCFIINTCFKIFFWKLL